MLQIRASPFFGNSWKKQHQDQHWLAFWKFKKQRMCFHSEAKWTIYYLGKKMLIVRVLLQVSHPSIPAAFSWKSFVTLLFLETGKVSPKIRIAVLAHPTCACWFFPWSRQLQSHQLSSTSWNKFQISHGLWTPICKARFETPSEFFRYEKVHLNRWNVAHVYMVRHGSKHKNIQGRES